MNGVNNDRTVGDFDKRVDFEAGQKHQRWRDSWGGIGA
jgi:hypothetical protein